MPWQLFRRRDDADRARARERHPSQASSAGEAGAARWPVRLPGRTATGVEFTLRPLTMEDGTDFYDVRRANREWLAPWDATSPVPAESPRTFRELVEAYGSEARAGRSLPFVVDRDGRLIGQMTLSSIILGSFRSCTAGYWVSRASAGLGIIPTALALAADHAIRVRGLHRIEVNIRPENTASLAVVRKLGFRDEGMRLRMLHIDGAWRDHRSFALTVEDLGGGTFLDRLNQLSQQPLRRHTEAPPGR